MGVSKYLIGRNDVIERSHEFGSGDIAYPGVSLGVLRLIESMSIFSINETHAAVVSTQEGILCNLLYGLAWEFYQCCLFYDKRARTSSKMLLPALTESQNSFSFLSNLRKLTLYSSFVKGEACRFLLIFAAIDLIFC